MFLHSSLLLLLAFLSLLATTLAQSSGTITLSATGSGCVIVGQAATLGTPFVLTKMVAICPGDGKKSISWPLTTAGDGPSSDLVFYSQLATSGGTTTPGCVLKLSQMQAMYCLGRDLEYRVESQQVYDYTAAGVLVDDVTFKPLVCGSNTDFLPSRLTLPVPGSGDFNTPITLVAGGGPDPTTKSDPPPEPSTSTPPPEPSTSSSTQGAIQGIGVSSTRDPTSSTRNQPSSTRDIISSTIDSSTFVVHSSTRTLTKTVTLTSQVTVIQGVDIGSSSASASTEASSSDSPPSFSASTITSSASSSPSPSSSSSKSHKAKSSKSGNDENEPHFSFSTFTFGQFINHPPPHPSSSEDCDCDDSSTRAEASGASGVWVSRPVTSSQSRAPSSSVRPQTSATVSIASSTRSETPSSSSRPPPSSSVKPSSTERLTTTSSTEFVFTQGSTTIGQFQTSGNVPKPTGDGLADILGLNAEPLPEEPDEKEPEQTVSTRDEDTSISQSGDGAPPRSTVSKAPKPSASGFGGGVALIEANGDQREAANDNTISRKDPKPIDKPSKRPQDPETQDGTLDPDTGEDVRKTSKPETRKRALSRRYGYGGRYRFGGGRFGSGQESAPSDQEQDADAVGDRESDRVQNGEGSENSPGGGNDEKACAPCPMRRSRSRLERSYFQRRSEQTI